MQSQAAKFSQKSGMINRIKCEENNKNYTQIDVKWGWGDA